MQPGPRERLTNSNLFDSMSGARTLQHRGGRDEDTSRQATHRELATGCPLARLPAKVHLLTCNKPAGWCTPGWQSTASIWAEALQTLPGSAGTGGLQRPFHIHRDYPQTIFRTGMDVFQNVIADIGSDLC